MAPSAPLDPLLAPWVAQYMLNDIYYTTQRMYTNGYCHAKWWTVHPQGCTQMGITFVYAFLCNGIWGPF